VRVDYKGVYPLIVHPHPNPLPSRERRRICRGFPLPLFRPLIELFRGDG